MLDADLGALGRDGLADVRRRAVAMVPQTSALLPFLTAEENIGLAIRLSGGRGDGTELLTELGVSDRRDHLSRAHTWHLADGRERR